uniref:Non-structural polyprotein 1AB n=1 Tax=Wenling banjofish astrovirus TaxID=2116415 RepID=A0A2P1GMD2_9VIRU|nr:ORF1b [Wenling banjofish astrovirus]
MVPKPDVEYDPPYWGPIAYRNVFDKHHVNDDYTGPTDQKSIIYANSKIISILRGAHATFAPLDATTKPTDSNPGFPYLTRFQSEQELIDSGNVDYERVFDHLKHSPTRPLYYVFLKNELLKPDKIENQEIRAIYVMPADLCRTGFRFDQYLNDYLKNEAPFNGVGVGLSGLGDGPQAFATHLGKKKFYYESDYKRYDGTVPSELMYHIRWLRTFGYDDLTREQFNQLENYSIDLVEKMLVNPFGDVAIVNKGNPSGQPSTSIDNCLINLWLTNYVYHHLYGEEVAEQMNILTYGDDRIISTDYEPDPHKEDLVLQTQFGMTIPPSSAIVSNKLEGLSFCGFRFRRSKSHWVADYKPDRILSGLRYPPNKVKDLEELYMRYLSAAILFAFSPVFDRIYTILKRLSRDTGSLLPHRGWFSFVNTGGGWAKTIDYGEDEEIQRHAAKEYQKCDKIWLLPEETPVKAEEREGPLPGRTDKGAQRDSSRNHQTSRDCDGDDLHRRHQRIGHPGMALPSTGSLEPCPAGPQRGQEQPPPREGDAVREVPHNEIPAQAGASSSPRECDGRDGVRKRKPRVRRGRRSNRLQPVPPTGPCGSPPGPEGDLLTTVHEEMVCSRYCDWPLPGHPARVCDCFNPGPSPVGLHQGENRNSPVESSRGVHVPIRKLPGQLRNEKPTGRETKLSSPPDRRQQRGGDGLSQTADEQDAHQSSPRAEQSSKSHLDPRGRNSDNPVDPVPGGVSLPGVRPVGPQSDLRRQPETLQTVPRLPVVHGARKHRHRQRRRPARQPDSGRTTSSTGRQQRGG